MNRRQYFLLFFVFSTLISLAHSNDHLGCLKCRKYNNRKINVHLVPHSHDDVGWLKTLDQYYYGTQKDVQDATVQYIITTTVNSLENNPERRFIQVETAFFWKWWKDQSQHMRQKFVNLVNNGQIEMINGGWSMNDEACVNYQSTIDQFTWGLRIINDTIGTCGIPRVGWQIDPFGHSKEQANIFAQLGYDGVVMARLDHDDKDKRRLEKSMDFAWQGNSHIGNRTIFASVLPTYLYQAPDGFCFDSLCEDEPIVDDVESPDYNIERKVDDFAKIIYDYAKNSTTLHVMLAMGGDFHYSNAERVFINTDKLIRGFENHSRIDVFYSTPSCYIKAINDFGPVLKLKTDDFFPYSDDPHNFWTGYFSSRPTNKRLERMGHNILQVTKQLYALHSLRFEHKYDSHLTRLREAMGTIQHHDAITGTEKQDVSFDYVRLLSSGIDDAEKPLGDIVRDLVGMGNINLDLKSCLLSNISICTTSQKSDKFIVFVYNPLAWKVTHYVRLPVETTRFEIHGQDGVELHDVTMPLSKSSFVDLKEKPAKLDLVFAARNIPPMGYKIYYVNKLADGEHKIDTKKSVPKYKFGTQTSGFEIDPQTNLLKYVTLHGKRVPITQNFYYYDSGNHEIEPAIASGAYIFRPDVNKANEVPTYFPKNKVTSRYWFCGHLVDEFHQTWNSYVMHAKQIIRVYKNEGYIEFDWIVGNLNITRYDVGREIVTRFSIKDSGFDNDKVFYTDSNGREMMERKLYFRPDYEYDDTVEPVAGNYYPVTSQITIQDKNKDLRVTVLNDRSQGGSSLNNGEIELMVHRRLVRDDNKGVNQYLDESEFSRGLYVRGSHYLIVGRSNGVNPDGRLMTTKESSLVQEKLLQPWIGLSPVKQPFIEMSKFVKKPFSAINEAVLPSLVNVLTFEPWRDGEYLLRLDYALQTELNTIKVTVNLKKLFNGMTIKSIRETTLGGNQWLDEYLKRDRYEWKLKGEAKSIISHRNDKSKWEIELYPMEIRTFILTFYVNK